MIRLPESSRFHVIDESKVLPRYGHLTPRPIYVYLPELAEHEHRRRFPCCTVTMARISGMIRIAALATAVGVST